jgi:hypothetical protein
MSIEMSQVYKSLLANANPSLKLQKKIYEYANKTNNSDLLSSLAGHSDLDPSIDLLLKNSDIASVKAAWASREGRTFTELEDLVKGETRVKILQALAEKEGLPEELYEAIAKQSKGQGALVSLCINQAVSFEVRELAAKNLSLIINITASNKNSKLGNTITSILTSSPDLADCLVAHSENSIILINAANTSALNPSNQLKIAKLMEEQVAEVKKISNKYAYGNFNWVSSTAENMSEFGIIDSNAAKLMLASLHELKEYHSSNGNNYYSEAAKDAVKKIESNSSKGFIDYVKAVSECSSRDELRSLVAKLSSLGATRSSRNLTFKPETVALAVIASSNSDLEMVDEVCEWLGWYSYRQALKVTNDISKIAMLLYHVPYLGVENVISKTSDPRKCLETLIEINIKKDSQISADILNSKYITKEVVSKLPLSVLYNDTLPGVILSMIGNQLEEGLNDDLSWSNFETIGPEYTGTLAELIKLSKAL